MLRNITLVGQALKSDLAINRDLGCVHKGMGVLCTLEIVIRASKGVGSGQSGCTGGQRPACCIPEISEPPETDAAIDTTSSPTVTTVLPGPTAKRPRG